MASGYGLGRFNSGRAVICVGSFGFGCYGVKQMRKRLGIVILVVFLSVLALAGADQLLPLSVVDIEQEAFLVMRH